MTTERARRSPNQRRAAIQSRRRAPAMSPEQRRMAIVQATLPLLAAHGANVTTRQIAQAAGIAEGTVFRAFPDKEELLRACVAEAFRTDQICECIRQVPVDNRLADRLEEAALLFVEHFERLGQLMEALSTSGHDVHKHGLKPPKGPEKFMRQVIEALTSVLEPDKSRCRVAPEDLARMLLGLVFTLRFDPEAWKHKDAAVRQRIDVLLHGALKTSEPQGGTRA